MAQHDLPDVPVWTAVLDLLADDDRVTPQMQGFLSLAVAQGVMGGTLYLDVPNDLTAAQLNKRLRQPIMEALAHVHVEPGASSYRVVVNPELADAHLTAPIPVQSASAPAPLRPAGEEYVETPVSTSRHDTRLNPKYT
ncbi:chromosomal replication initiator protein DnaA, partial [Microbacterium imperiale]